MDAPYETTDVVICGCGPTGAILSAYLGQSKVNNVCLDREKAITTDPRGIALDEDGIRALQGLGIYDQIYSKIGRCMGRFNFVGGIHNDLSAPPFMAMDYGTTEGGTGHVGFICHKQPELERQIREAIGLLPASTLRLGCTVVGIDEDDNWVYVKYRAVHGSERTLRAKFLVGTDGKTGYTRKQYLEPKGIVMERASQTPYEETWVAVNWQLTLPTPETHPTFPLWQLGYTPQQVYDLFFPVEFRFLCNPQRPAVCGRFGMPEDRLWRFEYVIQEGEDGDELSAQSKLYEIILPYLTHSGRRYQLSTSITYPIDCIETLRARPFKFSARSCNKWALGRVILCGDSAHVFPPFGGQGIASGFRDACSLAWRLRMISQAEQAEPINHNTVLEAWYHERKQQLERSLAATVENGAYVTESNPFKIALRNFYLGTLQLFPSGRRWLEKGARRGGMFRYEFQDGMQFLPQLHGGKLFPQVYCTPLIRQGDVGRLLFTDDIIFAATKKGLFQLVVLLRTSKELARTKKELTLLGDMHGLSNGHIAASEITWIIEDTNADATSMQSLKKTEEAPLNEPSVDCIGATPKIYRVATGTEFAGSRLCQNRPPPEYYDAYRIGKEVNRAKYIILRPDRFVFAACHEEVALRGALYMVEAVLHGRSL